MARYTYETLVWAIDEHGNRLLLADSHSVALAKQTVDAIVEQRGSSKWDDAMTQLRYAGVCTPPPSMAKAKP